MKPYPLICEPFYKTVMWGGKNLSALFPDTKKVIANTGELWEVSTHPDGLSYISNYHKGREYLCNVVENHPDWFPEKNNGDFPVLVKFIDASGRLSVQVHPDDDIANILGERDNGKIESWYILKSPPEGRIITGLSNSLTKDEIANVLTNERKSEIKKLLRYTDISDGDFINILPGTVHAILENTILVEIQQRSDLTYRIYDWDRVDDNGNSRKLHLKKAKASIIYENNVNSGLQSTADLTKNSWIRLSENNHYITEIGRFSDNVSLNNLLSETILICTRGSFTLEYNHEYFRPEICYPGQVIIFPAGIDGAEIIPYSEIELLSVILPEI